MRRALASLAAASALLMALAAPAAAEFGLKELDVTFTNADGSIATQAGSHPFAFTTTLGVNTSIQPGGEVPEGEVKDLEIGQIEGLVGSQTAVPRCSSADFNTRVEGRPSCPDSTAVGIVAVKAEFTVLPAGLDEYLHVPVYNLQPSPGRAAKLGFVALNVPIVIDVGVNPNPPYNLVAYLQDVPQAILFYGSKFTIWGNPASPLHDSLRGDCVGEPVELTEEPVSLGSCPVNVPEAPFLTLPRACQGPLKTVFIADSWAEIGKFTEPKYAETNDGLTPPNPLGMSGCSELGFGPTIAAAPTTENAESPSGLDLSFSVKDEGLTSPTGIAQSEMRDVVLTLPEGVTANPSAAEGLGACTPAQYAQASLGVRGCPQSSRLGSVRVKSPLLEEAVEGSLYLGQPEVSGGPETPLKIALYVIIRNDPNGIFVKFPVRVEPDPKTGQLLSITEDLPQLPISDFQLHFREGPRAPLTTPPTCGTYPVKAQVTPWSGNAPLAISASFKVSSGPGGAPCPAGPPPFNPSFEAGAINNNAGSYSPFYMRLTRADGEQSMTRFDSVLPPGVTGKLAGVAKCSDAALAAAEAKTGLAEIASPSCPPSSQIGRVLVGAGVGPALTYVPGKIYLAGPFGGAPLSAAVITPAVAGPFDVGTVVTREALDLNENTAEVEVDGAASDPIPSILHGVPLKVRDLRVYVDRQSFILNPTSCEPKSAKATLFGSGQDLFSPADDVPASLSAPFQAVNCENLGFGPKLSLKLKGGTKRNDHPALHSLLTFRDGDANIARAVVTLPPSEFIDPVRIGLPCTRAQFAAQQCPPGSVLGHARAFTPLLDNPLEGPVYFRSNGGARKVPDVVAALQGEGLRIVLLGAVTSKNARIRTTFLNVPDAPVTKFTLNLKGGKKGVLVNSANLCSHKRHVEVTLIGQNGKIQKSNPPLGTSCKG